jgi:hypothetical protein
LIAQVFEELGYIFLRIRGYLVASNLGVSVRKNVIMQNETLMNASPHRVLYADGAMWEVVSWISWYWFREWVFGRHLEGWDRDYGGGGDILPGLEGIPSALLV